MPAHMFTVRILRRKITNDYSRRNQSQANILTKEAPESPKKRGIESGGPELATRHSLIPHVLSQMNVFMSVDLRTLKMQETVISKVRRRNGSFWRT